MAVDVFVPEHVEGMYKTFSDKSILNSKASLTPGEKLVMHLNANLELDFKIDEIASPKRKLVLKVPTTNSPQSQALLDKFKDNRLEAVQKTK